MGGCCAAEMEAWQSCLLEKELSPTTKLDPPCTISSCSATSSASLSSDSSSSGLVAGLSIAVLLIIALPVGACVFFRLRCRRSRSSNNNTKQRDDSDSVDSSDVSQLLPPEKQSFVKNILDKLMATKILEHTNKTGEDNDNDVERGNSTNKNSIVRTKNDEEDSGERTASLTVGSGGGEAVEGAKKNQKASSSDG